MAFNKAALYKYGACINVNFILGIYKTKTSDLYIKSDYIFKNDRTHPNLILGLNLFLVIIFFIDKIDQKQNLFKIKT